MKKLFFVSALALSTFTFANTKNEKKQNVNSEKPVEVKMLTQEQKEILALILPNWSVSYVNACGTVNTVFFESNNPDGSPEFIRELAYAVNSTYDIC